MSSVRMALNTVLRRPVIVLLTGLFTLIYCIIDYFNPVTYLLMGFNRIGKGDFLESIIYTIQLLFNTVINTKNVFKDSMYFLLITVSVSIVLGVLLSGYFGIINKTLDNTSKSKGEFLQDTKEYSIRTAWVFFRVILSGLLFFIVMLIATVPAVIITKAWLSGKAEFILVMAFLDVLTFGIIFFGFTFFSIYIFFWIPASFNFRKKTFSMAKRIADKNFWHTVIQFLIFEIIFVIIHLILTYLNVHFSALNTGTHLYINILFALNWLIKTLFFSLFITFIFSSFKQTQSTMQLDN